MALTALGALLLAFVARDIASYLEAREGEKRQRNRTAKERQSLPSDIDQTAVQRGVEYLQRSNAPPQP